MRIKPLWSKKRLLVNGGCKLTVNKQLCFCHADQNLMFDKTCCISMRNAPVCSMERLVLHAEYNPMFNKPGCFFMRMVHLV